MTDGVEPESALYIVATPIGNLADISSRALSILESVQLIAAEDTRHSANLLRHYNIQSKLIAYHDFNDSARSQSIIDMLLADNSVALISDAGTPLISDPGYKLVKQAQELGITVVPVPGPCAATAALSVAGLPSDRFVFEGFLPARQQARQKHLKTLLLEPRSIIFYESPHRILDCLQDLTEVFGPDRRICLARELTKKFETVITQSLKECLQTVQGDSNQQKGEFVLIVAGADKKEIEKTRQDKALEILVKLQQSMSLKEAVALASELSGARKNQLYELALAQQKQN